MIQVIGVRFKKVGKVYYFDPGENSYREGDGVIVETSRGVELGRVALENKSVPEDKVILPLRPVIRAATEEDYACEKKNEERAKDAFKVCEKAISDHGLEMKLVDAEYTFDCSKVLFYFTAEGRVDFRELVKDLASIFRTRIELRQIGVRDEAKMLGGLGICGQPFCCSRFLGEFQPVSIKMAKEQGLSLNPTKISGTCGRLMCCLKYEQEAYDELLKVTPKAGSIVETPDGTGTVSVVGLLRGKLGVRLDEAPDAPPTEYDLSEITLLSGPKKGGRQERGEKPSENVSRAPEEQRVPRERRKKLEDALPPERAKPEHSEETHGAEKQPSHRRSRGRRRKPGGKAAAEQSAQSRTAPQKGSSPRTAPPARPHAGLDDKAAFELLQKLKQK